MSIQALVSILKDIEVNASKARNLAHDINAVGLYHGQDEMMFNYSHQTLVGIYTALRTAEALKAEIEKGEAK